MARQEDQSRNGGAVSVDEFNIMQFGSDTPIRKIQFPPKWSEGNYRTNCLRKGCGHSSDWHRLDDASQHGPGDPEAEFRCLGYDPSAPGPYLGRQCDCPDMVR